MSGVEAEKAKAKAAATAAATSRQQVKFGSSDNVFTFNLSVDVMAVFLTLAGLALRIPKLSHPNNVVFDEMHYGKYALLYLKGIFFFDSNPPLGKLLLAAVAYAAGFEGEFDFEKIGVEYTENVPVAALRFLPALCGSLITPAAYLILCELGLSQWAGGLAGILLVLGEYKGLKLLRVHLLFIIFRDCRHGHSCPVALHSPRVHDDLLQPGGPVQRAPLPPLPLTAVQPHVVDVDRHRRLQHGMRLCVRPSLYSSYSQVGT